HVPVRLERLAEYGDPVWRAVRLTEGECRVDGVGDEAPACYQIVVGALEHAQQLRLARRVVEQIDRGDQVKAAELGQFGGVVHQVLDARGGLRLLGARQTHHLRGNIDAYDLRGAPLLELLGVEAEAAGQIQNTLPCELAYHAEKGITLGALQGG